jgi:hypothetical protein
MQYPEVDVARIFYSSYKTRVARNLALSLFYSLSLLLFLSACSLIQLTFPSAQQTAENDLPVDQPPTSLPTLETPPVALPGSSTEIPDVLPTNQVFLPGVLNNDVNPEEVISPESHPPELAYLSDGNLWLVQIPEGEAQIVTQTGDLLNFAWSPDGSQLATFNGRELCLLNLDGTEVSCYDLGLNDYQAQVPRRIAWSPNQGEITLWNTVNPWDEQAIGWIIVSLDGIEEIVKIQDPVDWGATLTPENEPGGVTGEALYLADGTLVGTITHHLLCGESGCHYELYYFDPADRRLHPYPNKPEEGFSEGSGLVLSADKRQLINFGTFHTGCEAFITFLDAFDLAEGTRHIYDFPQAAINAFALSPDASHAVMAHNAGCSTQNQNEWAQACGLFQEFDVYPMLSLDLGQDTRSNLLPGLQPAWSPDGNWLAFRSCLAQGAGGTWEPTTDGPPGIYVLNWSSGALVSINEGETPQWRP